MEAARAWVGHVQGARGQVTLKSVASLVNEASPEIAAFLKTQDSEVVLQLHKGCVAEEAREVQVAPDGQLAQGLVHTDRKAHTAARTARAGTSVAGLCSLYVLFWDVWVARHVAGWVPARVIQQENYILVQFSLLP